MSSTNKTANYKLSQFIGTDKPTFLGDYNNDMEIIDAALFSASQTAEQAVNDVESVKGAQAELKNVHTETQEQVAQLKETADGMTGDVTAAQDAANSAEEKATEAQNAATNVVNAANAASANATIAKQTADGNASTITQLTERVEVLENKKTDVKISCEIIPQNRTKGQDTTFFEAKNGTSFKNIVCTTKTGYEFYIYGDTNLIGTVNNSTKTFSADVSQYKKLGFSAQQYTGEGLHNTLAVELVITS